MQILKSAVLLAVICSTIGTLEGQTPTPAQGRDYTAANYKVVAVDAQGRLIISPTGSSSGCPGTVMTPCVVAGVDSGGNIVLVPVNATGAPPANASSAAGDTVLNTVLFPTDLAGTASVYEKDFLWAFNGTTWDRIRTAAGSVDGVAGTGSLRANPINFNGATYDRQFLCPNPVAVSLSASGTTQILALSGTTKIRVCGVYLTAAAPVNLQLFRGTGSNCGTGNAALGGLYQITSTLALDFGNWSALTTNAGDALCLSLSTSTTVSGTVTIAQF